MTKFRKITNLSPLRRRLYDADARVIDRLEVGRFETVIPPTSNRNRCDLDKALYKASHFVESFFENLEHYETMATQSYRTTASLPGAIHRAD